MTDTPKTEPNDAADEMDDDEQGVIGDLCRYVARRFVEAGRDSYLITAVDHRGAAAKAQVRVRGSGVEAAR